MAFPDLISAVPDVSKPHTEETPPKKGSAS
jgi:hypothetical protein